MRAERTPPSLRNLHSHARPHLQLQQHRRLAAEYAVAPKADRPQAFRLALGMLMLVLAPLAAPVETRGLFAPRHLFFDSVAWN